MEQTYCGWLRNPIHFASPKKPWFLMIPPQISINYGFPWFQSGTKWISSIHDSANRNSLEGFADVDPIMEYRHANESAQVCC